MAERTDGTPVHVDAAYERLLHTLALATFLVFFQAYMVAPLIPRLATLFGTSPVTAGIVVPAYLVPYGLTTLLVGVLADRMGRRRLMLGSLGLFTLLAPMTATSRTVWEFASWRAVTGIGASAVVPLALSLIGVRYPYASRGRPLGWIFGAMAGGMAAGSTLGAVLEPVLGWRGEFIALGILSLPVGGLLLRDRALLDIGPRSHVPLVAVAAGYRALLTSARGKATYLFVLLNAVFHSGVFTWLGLYFTVRHGLGVVGIGLALLGYGLPGFVLGPVIGRAADRWGRRWLIPGGLAIAAIAALLLIPRSPIAAAAIVVTGLSLGYDMTQPLLAGVVTSLGASRGGQAMGLNVFLLFIGFGLGSYAFGQLATYGLETALLVFGTLQLLLAGLAVSLFRGERAQSADPANM